MTVSTRWTSTMVAVHVQKMTILLIAKAHDGNRVVVCDTGIDPTSVNTGPVQIAM